MPATAEGNKPLQGKGYVESNGGCRIMKHIAVIIISAILTTSAHAADNAAVLRDVASKINNTQGAVNDVAIALREVNETLKLILAEMQKEKNKPKDSPGKPSGK